MQPYARLDKEDGLQYLFADVEYSEFPMMRYLALAHFIEMNYNQIEFKGDRSHAVSEALVAEMARLAKEFKVKFILANIEGDHAMLDFAEKNRIPHIDISVDLNLPEHINLPHDDHPSVIANEKYADKEVCRQTGACFESGAFRIGTFEVSPSHSWMIGLVTPSL